MTEQDLKQIKLEGLEVAKESFNEARNSSDCDVCGGEDETDFIYNGKTYSVSWEGYWEGSMYFDYKIFGNNIDINAKHQY